MRSTESMEIVNYSGYNYFHQMQAKTIYSRVRVFDIYHKHNFPSHTIIFIYLLHKPINLNIKQIEMVIAKPTSLQMFDMEIPKDINKNDIAYENEKIKLIWRFYLEFMKTDCV